MFAPTKVVKQLTGYNDTNQLLSRGVEPPNGRSSNQRLTPVSAKPSQGTEAEGAMVQQLTVVAALALSVPGVMVKVTR